MKKSEFGKWIHPAFTGACFAYFLAVVDKAELLASNYSLAFATASFALALVLNSIWTAVYYALDGEVDFDTALTKHWIFRRFDSLSQWSFIFAVIALVYYVVEPIISIVL